MGDEIQPSKKRAAGRELSRDNPGLDDEEDVPEQEMGTFKKASDDVLAGRRIVKVRRQQSSTAPSAPSSNPFAGIRLVPPAPAATPTNATVEAQAPENKIADASCKKDATDKESEVTSKQTEAQPGETATDTKDEEKEAPEEQAVEANKPDRADAENAAEKAAEPNSTEEKEATGSAEKKPETEPTNEEQAEGDQPEDNVKKDLENSNGGAGDAPLSSFQQLSNSKNAFSGFASSGFSTTAFSFGSTEKDCSASQSSLPSFSFGSSNPGNSPASQSSFPTFSFGSSNNGTTPLFGTTGVSSLGSKSEGPAFRSMPEVPTETGEENEETVFAADSALFEFVDSGWKERGKGEVKLNVLKDESRKARLVMRAKGNLRLILNASLYPDMKLTKNDKKGITFACVNTATEGKGGLSTFALKFKDVSILEEFSAAASAHMGKTATALKTPENSPRASEN